jgi:dihydroorotase (multifunctional complex type)
MEHDLVLEGRVVAPGGLAEMEVGVSDGMIAELGRHSLRGSRRIRAERCLIFPGFVDIHVHLREPGWEYKEDFRTGTEAAVHGGVTTVVDMPNNPVPTTTPAAVEEKQRLARAKALVDVKLYGGVVGGDLEGIRKVSGAVVGYKVYLARTTGELLFPPEQLGAALARIAEVGRPVSLHCEDQSVIERRTKELSGVRRPDVYCDMRPPEAEVESARRVLASLEGMGGISANVCHASTAATLRLVEESRMRGNRVACEAALHHLFFSRREMLDNRMLRTNPPLRPEEDRKALVEGIEDGRVSFLVTDHSPHTQEEKLSKGLSGVPGLDDYAHIVSWLVASRSVRPEAVGRAASANPAEFLGLLDRGAVAVGRRADFAILDMKSNETVRSEDVRSKCGWSPYEGKEFPGRARWTVRGGEVLLDDYELVT